MNEFEELQKQLKALNQRLWEIRKGQTKATPAEQSELARQKREITARLGKLAKRRE
jgi:hypothetical protein